MTTLSRTAGAAGSITLTTKNSAGQLITPVSAPTAKWYTDTDRTLGETALTVAGSGSSYTASWLAGTAPATPATRYLKFTIEVSSGVFDVDADDDVSFVDAVADLSEITVTIAEVKARLNKTLTVDDAEIEDMILAAEAEYRAWVGPISGTVVEKHDGGRSLIVLRSANVSEVTAATYTDGTVIDVDDLDLDTLTGIVRWDYNTAGYFTAGHRNVSLTYTLAALPANHREAIIADVAGYFQATQNGPVGLPGDEGYQEAWNTTPVTIFPRIRALAVPSIA